MSKIVPKSMQSQSSQNIKANQSRNKNTESDVMFAALFGGVRGEISSEGTLIGKASMTTMMSAVSGEENFFDEQISDDLMALKVSLQDGRGLGQKVTGLQDDALNDGLELEQAPTLPDSEIQMLSRLLRAAHCLKKHKAGRLRSQDQRWQVWQKWYLRTDWARMPGRVVQRLTLRQKNLPVWMETAYRDKIRLRLRLSDHNRYSKIAPKLLKILALMWKIL